MVANISLTKAVWDRSAHRGAALLVLLALADFANERGHAWPKVDSLARRTRITRRYCLTLLQRLAESGEITIEALPKDRRRRLFQLVAFLPALTAANSSGKRADSRSKKSPGHEPSTRSREAYDPGPHPPGFDIPARLQALAELLPQGLLDRDQRQQQILGLEGGMDRIEAQLQRLDQDLVDRLEARLEPEEREAIEERVQEALHRLRGRLPAHEMTRQQQQLFERLLRGSFELPQLSLFSPALDEVFGP